MSVRRSLLAAAAIVTGACFPAAAVPFAAVINSLGGTQLIGFDSAAPSTITNTLNVTGLRGRDSLSGIDTRPATGQLYALGGQTVGTPGQPLHDQHHDGGRDLRRDHVGSDHGRQRLRV